MKKIITKTISTLFLFYFLTTSSFAQGIAVQGIARDNTSSAITNTTLTYTFSITKSDNTVQYAETQSIKTDNFGVFSHIVSTGNPVTNTFMSVDFSLANLKIKVSVNYSGGTIEVYDQPFQYVPYAKYAENGVPTGTVVSFLGATAPRGWLLCDGSAIPTIHTILRSIVGNSTPNLKGMFLRGTGESALGAYSTGPSLGTYQNDAFKSHLHGKGTLNTRTGVIGGNIPSSTRVWQGADIMTARGGIYGPYKTIMTDGNRASTTGKHDHDITGSVASTGAYETRPVNYGVNYIIKL